MQQITKEKIKYLAELSRIAVTDADCEMFATDLSGLSELAERLEALPSERDRFDGAVSLSQLRSDTSKTGLSREALLQSAPACDAESFLVPRTVEE